jgi:hypothetical protein
MSKRNLDADAVAEPKTKKPRSASEGDEYWDDEDELTQICAAADEEQEEYQRRKKDKKEIYCVCVLDESKNRKVIDLTGAPVVRYGTLLTPRQERLCRGDARYVSVSDLVTQYEEQMNFRYYFVEDEEKKKWCIDLDMRWFKSCDKEKKIEQLVLAIQSKRDILTVQLIKEERENV